MNYLIVQGSQNVLVVAVGVGVGVFGVLGAVGNDSVADGWMVGRSDGKTRIRLNLKKSLTQ